MPGNRNGNRIEQNADLGLLDQIERRGLVWLGLLEIALGTLFSVLVIPLHAAGHEKSSTFFSHLGVGLLAAGLLTASVEAIAHRRSGRFLQKMQETTELTLLKRLIPQSVFPEVENQIIAKPFTRSDLRLELQFAWEDEEHTRLRRRARVSYRVMNESHVPQVFELRAGEDWTVNEPPEFVDITYLSVRREKEEEGSAQNLATAEKKKREKDRLQVKERVPLSRDESVSVVWKSLRDYPAQDKTPMLFNHATRGLTLNVHHPADLGVALRIHHPNDAAFQVDADDADYHAWHFDGGFLPFQGVTLSWKKLSPPPKQVPVLALAGETLPDHGPGESGPLG